VFGSKTLAVTGRKSNANKARAPSELLMKSGSGVLFVAAPTGGIQSIVTLHDILRARAAISEQALRD